jgi:hypothetical protein
MRELLGMSVLLMTVLFGCSPPVEPTAEIAGTTGTFSTVTAPSATAPRVPPGTTAGYVFDPFAPSATGGAIALGPPLKMRKENVERVTFTPKDDPAELPPILRPLGALIQRLHPHGKAPHFTYDPDNPRRVLDVDLSFQGPIEAKTDRYDLIILGDFPELKELKLQNLVVRQDNLAVLFDAPKLETACFRKSHLEGPDVLWPIHRATSLTDLDLAETNLTDDQLHRLRRCSSITCLDLSETEIDGSGFDALGGLQNLEALYLKETKVHGEGLEYIAQLPELRHLYWPVIAIDRFSLVNRFEWFFDPFFDIGPPLDPDYQGRSVEIAHQPRWHSVKLILKYPVEQITLRDCPMIRTLTIENEVPEQLKTLRKIHISDCRFLLKIVSDTPCREVVLPKNEEENSRRREKIRLEIPTLPETVSPAPSSPLPTPAFSPPTTPSTE